MTSGSADKPHALLGTIHRGLSPILCIALLVACGSAPKRGGYYENDGPPDRAPLDLSGTPDAEPRVEPFLNRANRPYTALGRSYTPLTSDVPFRQKGTASWYGKQFHGNRTASGEIYDMFAMTAAHPTLPIPSYVRVVNPRNGRAVIVRVNDRGPFKNDRIIDLSYGAATKLGIAGSGTGEVEIERLTFTQIASGDWRRSAGQVMREGSPPVPPPVVEATAASTVARWSVQVGAFADQANAEDLAKRVATVLGFAEGDLPGNPRDARVERHDNAFRVLVGALPDRASALSLAQQLERLLGRPVVPFSR
ncbi:MAG: septal ring lytic transglycosylase RlpA family protein [Burkholderiaceae bacterium]